mmetsp:Transcript_25671/g.64085  ORF Transcript_25671/g.64085 Transcript_25671/m.64085 type:complete len:256 (+) Transcript_25671:619-1386(+)
MCPWCHENCFEMLIGHIVQLYACVQMVRPHSKFLLHAIRFPRLRLWCLMNVFCRENVIADIPNGLDPQVDLPRQAARLENKKRYLGHDVEECHGLYTECAAEVHREDNDGPNRFLDDVGAELANFTCALEVHLAGLQLNWPTRGLNMFPVDVVRPGRGFVHRPGLVDENDFADACRREELRKEHREVSEAGAQVDDGKFLPGTEGRIRDVAADEADDGRDLVELLEGAVLVAQADPEAAVEACVPAGEDGERFEG